MSGTALVTGGSGYIAGFCIRQLLAEGWQVRTTVRSKRREAEVRRWLGGAAEGPQLAFFEADLTADTGWAEAVAGASHVLHVASPLPVTLPKSDDEIVIPAREGTLRVLRAARDAGAKRVVVTSSTAAITYGTGKSQETPFTEKDWTNERHPDTSPYIRSKTIAEKAAWAWLKAEGGALEMATVNPGAVIGPVLGKDFSASIEIVRKLLKGDFPGSPRIGFPLVDVRDIADLHVRAMTHPQAAGERFLGAGDFLWIGDIARVLRARLPQLSKKVPKGGLPDFMVRLAAIFDAETRSVVFELGIKRPASSAKAIAVLGWRMRPLEESIVDTAESLVAQGAVTV